jgi:hypothetical protein
MLSLAVLSFGGVFAFGTGERTHLTYWRIDKKKSYDSGRFK